MKKTNVILLLGAVCLALFIVSCTGNQKSGDSDSDGQTMSAGDLVKRGEYLVTIMGCNDCHSPKRMGPDGPEVIPELMLSGLSDGPTCS